MSKYIDKDGNFVQKQVEVIPVEDGYTGRLEEEWYVAIYNYDGIVTIDYVDHEPTEKEIFVRLMIYGGNMAQKVKMFSPEYKEEDEGDNNDINQR